MKNELTKRNISRICIAFLLLALTACSVCIGILASGRTGGKLPPDMSQNGSGNFTQVQALSLAMSADAVTAADKSISKTVTATVYPTDAKNKAVDWQLEWLDEKDTTDISEYLTLTPESDGSLTATLTCHKPFEGEALITATSREGNVFDTCRAVYVGNPTSLELQPQGFSPTTGSIGTYYELGAQNSYTFNLLPDNVFGQVGADCNYTYEVTGVGSIKAQDVIYKGVSNTYEWQAGTESTVALSSITTVSKYEPSLYECSISGTQLTVKINCTLESYYEDSQRSGQNVYYTHRFKEYSGDNWYYELKVTETNSGVSKSFRFRPVKVVTNVNIPQDVITF